MEYVKQINTTGLTIESAFKNNIGQLNIVAKECGHNELKVVIISLVIDLIKFFSQTEPLTLEQIAVVADFILEDHSEFLTIEDIIICFKRSKKKLYKKDDKNWARIQGSDILDWVGYYEKEKLEAIMKIRTAEKNKLITDSMDKELDPETKMKNEKQWADLKAKIAKVGSPKFSRPVRNYNRSEEAQMKYNHARLLFDDLITKQESPDGLIEHNGSRINFNQYLLTL